MGISIAQYSKIENGDKPLTIYQLARIAQVFNLAPWELLEVMLTNGSVKEFIKIRGRGEAARPADTAEPSGNSFHVQLACYYEQKYLELYARFADQM